MHVCSSATKLYTAKKDYYFDIHRHLLICRSALANSQVIILESVSTKVSILSTSKHMQWRPCTATTWNLPTLAVAHDFD